MLQKLNSMINASRHNSHKSQLFHCVTKKRFTKEIYVFCSTCWMGLEIDIFPTVFHKASAFAVPRLLGRTGYGIRAKCWRRSTSLESAPTMWVQNIFEIGFLSQSKIVSEITMWDFCQMLKKKHFTRICFTEYNVISTYRISSYKNRSYYFT